MNNEIPNGIAVDTRPQEEKEKDYLHEKLYSGLPIVWLEKPRETWKIPSQRNQSTSLSCVKQSSATAMEVFLKKVISAGTYKLRADPTQGGMYLQNCGDLDYKIGTILESVTPSQNMNEQQMNAIELPSLLNVKITGYRTFNNMDIDKIAEAIQAYGNCFLIFDSNGIEWTIRPVYLGTPTTFGHCICAVDFTLIDGIKYIICMDSSGQWSSPTGIREISEDFLKKRARGAMYYLGAKIEPIQPPTAHFEANLSYGESSEEIKRLQTFLKKLGYFAANPTGYFGDITRSAVFHFQEDHVNLTWWERYVLRGKIVGVKTRLALNSLI